MVAAADFVVATSRGSMTAVVTERSLGGFISADLVLDFGGEIQTMDDSLTWRDGCAAAPVTSHACRCCDCGKLMTTIHE